MAQALIGRPGWPPGKSQGEFVRARVAWLQRTVTCLEGEVSDGGREFDGDGAEVDAGACVRLLDVVDGEPGDRGGPLHRGATAGRQGGLRA